MNYSRIKSELGERKIRNLYLLYGNESFLIEKLCDRISALADEAAGRELERLDFGKELDADELGMALGTVSFFGTGKIIFCRDTGIFRDRSRSEKFSGILSNMPGDSYVIFTEKNVDERNPLFQEMKKAGYAYRIEMRKSGEIMGYIKNRFIRNNKKISSENLALFVELSGNSLCDIESDIEKLLLYMGELKEVRREYITGLCSGSSSHRVYEFTDAVFEKDRDRAYVLMKDILSDRIPVQFMISAIHTRLMELLLVRGAMDRGEDPEVERYNKPVADFVLRILRKQAAGYTEGTIRKHIKDAAALDHDIKTGRMDGNAGLEILVNSLTRV